jgi:hypothetical protein
LVRHLKPGLASKRSVPACDCWIMTTTVLIVDDHETFRSFARAPLESEGFEVIGRPGTARRGSRRSSRSCRIW